MIKEFNNSSEKVQGTNTEAGKTTQKTKVTETSMDYKAISRARKGFNLSLSEFKTNDLKLAYLRNAAASFDDKQKFFNRYVNMAKELEEKLSDSVSVVKACEENGINLFVLATHVVFMGKTAVQRVARFGVGEKSPIHGQLDLFKDSFLPLDPQDFVNTGWKPSEHKNETGNAN